MKAFTKGELQRFDQSDISDDQAEQHPVSSKNSEVSVFQKRGKATFLIG